MIKVFLKCMVIGIILMSHANAELMHKPYLSEEANYIYNLLFCDDESLFNSSGSTELTYWQKALFIDKDKNKIYEIAKDKNEESRLRVLAYNWLRKNGHSVPEKVLLGVIVEVPLEDGLDVVAAYPDGRARYINQSGKIVVSEGGYPKIDSLAKELVQKSIEVVNNIGPWDKPRLPEPEQGNIRLTFLVSDGLYFGEGPFSLMQGDPMAAPIISKAVELLQAVVNSSDKGT